ncbi:MAG: hypothetical protein M1826_001145 [Phylliscum demangeonii]|nr:MAG: hypothetical protein M1826_001145 [Phylliscum demangeonii]
MPRQRRSGGAPARSAPSRPVVAPQRAPQQQARPATTAAMPPATTTGSRAPATQTQAGQPQTGSKAPGLFGQMASTAAGVAVGSSIGHAIGGFFGGGSSSAAQPAETAQTNAAATTTNGMETGFAQDSFGARSCELDAKQFTQCLDQNQGNMQICGWYLEQLKACQREASQY